MMGELEPEKKAEGKSVAKNGFSHICARFGFYFHSPLRRG
jgi:hypothetical protein